jgi:hypothetical protein
MPVPYGVALDVGSEGQGALFPPVMGIVPDAAALDADMDAGANDMTGMNGIAPNGEELTR